MILKGKESDSTPRTRAADLLDPDYLSETFRVLKDKETRLYGEYRTQRLVLAEWDTLEAGGLV